MSTTSDAWNEWENLCLADICDRVNESARPDPNGNRIYLGLEHLQSGFPSIRGIGIESEVKSGKTAFRSGDILFGKLRPYLQKSVIAPFDGICSTDILVFRAKIGTDATFLGFLTHTREFVDFAKATQSGVQHPRTSWPSLKSCPVMLPALSEQRKIAAVLSLVQRAIEQQERLIALTTELKKALMQKLFTEGLRGESQKETEIGLIPESWDVARLDEVALIERGKFSHRPRNDPRFYGGGTPFVQTGDVTESEGRIRRFSQSLNDLGLSVSKVFPKGTILITIAANIGYSGILEFDSACPDSLIGLTPKADITAEYLQFYLSTQQEEMDRLAPRGTQKNINIQFLKPWPVALPKLEEQQEIVNLLCLVDQRKQFADRNKQALTDLFRTLLHQLMTAQIRVADLDLSALMDVEPVLVAGD